MAAALPPISKIDPALAMSTLRELRADRERMQRAREEADAMRQSLRKFVAAAWHQMEPAMAYIPAWHIDAICEHLQAAADGHILRLLITVPPGSAKSLLSCVAFPAFVWARRPEWRSTYLSYDNDLSTRDSVRCRDLLQSRWYQEVFQPQWTFASDQNEKTYYVNSAKGFRVSGRGTGWRGHAIIMDDPLNAKERTSDASLAACVDLWDNVLFNRFIDMAKALKIIIMQRLGDRDLAGHVLRQGGYEHLKIPLEYDPSRSKVTTLRDGVEWRDPRKTRGEIMCPGLFPPEVVAEIKKNPDRMSSQYQQEPNVDGGGILKSHAWNYWKPAHLKLPPVRVKMPNGDIQERIAVDLPARSEFDLILQTWDMAVKDLKTSDFVCGQVHAAKGAQRFILKQKLERMGIVATMDAVREMTADFPEAHLKLIEDKANGSPVIEMMEKEISGMIRVNPEDGKVARAAAASPELEAGNWFLPHPMIAPWVGSPELPIDGGGFLASTSLFPYGTNDDDVDAWSQGAIRIQKEKVGGVFGVSEGEIRVQPFELKDIAKWPKAYGIHIDWREIGAVWICRQPETSQHYLWAEYSVPSSDPAQHAASVKKMGPGIQGYMVADAGTRELKDGYAIVRRYGALGLHLETIPENIDSSVIDLSDALKSGKLKVFGNLEAFFTQFRLFRRDARGKLPTMGIRTAKNMPTRDSGLVLAALIAWSARDRLRAPLEKVEDPNTTRGGWMSA